MRWLPLLLVVLFTSAAAATPPGATHPLHKAYDEPDDHPWYGLQTLAADGLTFTAALLAGYSDQDDLGMAVLVTGYMFAAPGVHAAHGQGGRALGSMGLRLVMPFVGLAVADNGDIDELIMGTLGGAAIASLFDAFVIARGYSNPKPRTWAPTIRQAPGGVMLGIGGSL
ncbi:MAG: hypothetical protein AB7O24_01865 [Kofleriaceae bacterium]